MEKPSLENTSDQDRLLNSIVQEVIRESHIDPALLLPEDVEYIRQHVLKKPLRAIHIWSLGVGVVITGEYFGWNFGLPVAGPIGMLIASLIVCGLYLTWVLGLSELSVAMPFAGGPMAYGRRALGRGFGFLMGWSMFLECLFAAIGTALATGGYVAFLLNPDHPDPLTTTISAILCVLLFLVVQYIGVKEQAVITLWLTYAAIGALVWFWIAAIPGVSLARILTKPLLPGGWAGVLGAVPYALWWLVMIETVALASEEAHEPHISIPKGLVLAQITLVILVVLTWFFVCAAAPYQEAGAVVYPLPLVFKKVWGTGWFLQTFSAVALAGMVVSYCAMLYATSRQLFSLGRAGYVPRALGTVHSTRRTPGVSLIVCTVIAICFIVFGHFQEQATAISILISTLTAVIWYILAMTCLLVLRRREPRLFRSYQSPVFPWLIIFVGLLSAFAGYLYVWVNVQVILPTMLLYAAAGIWYGLWGRHHVLTTAPEEVAARIAQKMSERDRGTPAAVVPNAPSPKRIVDYITAAVLLAGLLSLVWMVARASHAIPGPPANAEILSVGGIWVLLFILVSIVGYRSTLKKQHPGPLDANLKSRSIS
ncbi:MAG TPA: amino acid permease [Bryobacteraceae bacterium]|nr:amino acid permease [Bryobacteraceae bacterium]